MCAVQIERRLAPFWKGLDDHSSSWTEHQLVAAARGLPIPAADEIPPEMARSGSNNPRGSDVNLNSLTVPITSRSQSFQSDKSANGRQEGSSASQLFRGRAKTLASFATGSKSSSPSEPLERMAHLPSFVFPTIPMFQACRSKHICTANLSSARFVSFTTHHT
jgi:hypothetical protein